MSSFDIMSIPIASLIGRKLGPQRFESIAIASCSSTASLSLLSWATRGQFVRRKSSATRLVKSKPSYQHTVRNLSTYDSDARATSSPYTVRVHALSVAARIDLKSLLLAIQSIDPVGEELRGSRWFITEVSRDWLHFSLRPLHEDLEGSSQADGRARGAHVSVSKRGSVVFTNCDLADAIYLLDILQELTAGLPDSATASLSSSRAAVRAGFGSTGPGNVRTLPRPLASTPSSPATSPYQQGAHRTLDSLTILVDPSLPPSAAQASPTSTSSSSPSPASSWLSPSGLVRVRRLDPASVSTLAEVLAMSVTLQEHELALEPLGEAAAALNDALAEGGGQAAGQLRADFLHGILTECSRITADLTLSHVSDVPRPGSPAWADERLTALHRLLVEDFDISARRDDLEHRLQHVAKLAKAALGYRRDAQMTRLEWLIVLILTVDLALLISKEVLHKEGGEAAEADRASLSVHPDNADETALHVLGKTSSPTIVIEPSR